MILKTYIIIGRNIIEGKNKKKKIIK